MIYSNQTPHLHVNTSVLCKKMRARSITSEHFSPLMWSKVPLNKCGCMCAQPLTYTLLEHHRENPDNHCMWSLHHIQLQDPPTVCESSRERRWFLFSYCRTLTAPVCLIMWTTHPHPSHGFFSLPTLWASTRTDWSIRLSLSPSIFLFNMLSYYNSVYSVHCLSTVFIPVISLFQCNTLDCQLCIV